MSFRSFMSGMLWHVFACSPSTTPTLNVFHHKVRSIFSLLCYRTTGYYYLTWFCFYSLCSLPWDLLKCIHNKNNVKILQKSRHSFIITGSQRIFFQKKHLWVLKCQYKKSFFRYTSTEFFFLQALTSSYYHGQFNIAEYVSSFLCREKGY